jgi:hypothetical protein
MFPKVSSEILPFLERHESDQKGEGHSGNSFLYSDFFFLSTRAWTQSCQLARQVLYHLSHTPIPFMR